MRRRMRRVTGMSNDQSSFPMHDETLAARNRIITSKRRTRDRKATWPLVTRVP